MRRLAIPLFILAVGACDACGGSSEAVRPPTSPPRKSELKDTGEAASGAPTEAGQHFTFRVDEALTQLDAEICFSGAMPERLDAPDSDAWRHLVFAKHGERALFAPGRETGEISLAGVDEGECVHYRVDLASVLTRERGGDGAQRYPGVTMLSPDWWLWMPAPRDEASHARFELPATITEIVPWQQGEHGYRIPESAFLWKSLAAFAQTETLDRRQLQVTGGELDLVVVGDGFGDREEAAVGWVKRSAEATAGLYGRFPVSRALVFLIAEPARRGSFGFALRGGGPTTTLLMPANLDVASLDDEWAAVHEMVHFSLPPMPGRDAWLYEGVGTYVTAIARARAGIISEDEAWWELLDGFERGRRVGGGVSLREEAETMHENRTYWRVYWAGCAMALSMDVQLRERGSSLVAAIGSLVADGVDSDRKWTSEEVLAELDRRGGGDVCASVAEQHVERSRFPDTATLTAELGVALDAQRRVVYDDSAPKAAIRKQIMRRAR